LGFNFSSHSVVIAVPLEDMVWRQDSEEEIMQAFRESARPWPCHLYAFASPNSEALKALVKLSPIVEIGAGVGYWAALLRQQGAEVVAIDQNPTADCTGSEINQYHGKVPPWTKVERGDATCSANYRFSPLLKCMHQLCRLV
jgi:methylase of polypeptide subunit release factors